MAVVLPPTAAPDPITLQPGVNVTLGQEPEILRRLRALAAALKVRIFIISGARPGGISPSTGQPVGFPNDPHTRGQAADIGVNAPTLASAGMLTDAQLARFGLFRPFKTPSEINHVQLLPGSGIDLGALGSDAAKVGGTAIGVGQAIGGPLTLGVGILGDTILGHGVGGPVGDAASAAENTALAPVKLAVNEAAKELGSAGLRILLYSVLILGGAAMALYGLARAAGVDDNVGRAAKSTTKKAAVAAAA
jgi:hypothetical protein